MNKMFKSLLLCAVAGVAGIVLAPTPASAFWVDTIDEYAFIDPIRGPQGPNYTMQAGLDSQVFLNEVDPDYVVEGPRIGEVLYRPVRAKYEIAAPNGTDLTGWKFLIYQGYSTYDLLKVRTTWHTRLMQEIDLTNAFATGPKFGDQQQGWGFKSFEGAAPTKYNDLGFEWGIVFETENMDAHYVLLDNHNRVVQALSYRNTITFEDGPAAGITTTSIYGMSFAMRKSTIHTNEGSWKLNNVNLRPDSTYGSLQYVTGVPGAKLNPPELHWDNQWDTPTPNRHKYIFSPPTPLPTVWDQINFVPGDLIRLCGPVRQADWGKSYCNKEGDTGYFFDETGGDKNIIPPIADRQDKAGKHLVIPIVDASGAELTAEQKQALKALGTDIGLKLNSAQAVEDAKENIKFSWLPEGITFNRTTGALEGTITKPFPRTKIIVEAKNPKFLPSGYNGHGITYRTFFWESAGIDNDPPVITVEPFTFEENVHGAAPIKIVDPENDAIVSVNLAGVDPKSLPRGLKLEGTNAHPRLVTDGTTPKGHYLTRITAVDDKGSIGYLDLMVVIKPAKQVIVDVNTLVADSGEIKSVPIMLKTNTNKPTSVSIHPNQTPVPPDLYTKIVNGTLRLFTGGRTPAGEYSITVRGSSAGIIGEKGVYVKINDVGRPNGLNFKHATVLQGEETKIPVYVDSSGAVQTTIQVRQGDVNTGDFGIIEADTTRPMIVVNPQTKPGNYILKITASNPNRPENNLHGYMKVRVVAESNGPVIGLSKGTALAKSPRETVFNLLAEDPLGGAVSLKISNDKDIPAGISIEDGNLIVAPGLPENTYDVEVTATNTHDQRTVKTIEIEVR